MEVEFRNSGVIMTPVTLLWTLFCKVVWKGCCLRTAVYFLGSGTQAAAAPDVIAWGVLVPVAVPASGQPCSRDMLQEHLGCVL